MVPEFPFATSSFRDRHPVVEPGSWPPHTPDVLLRNDEQDDDKALFPSSLLFFFSFDMDITGILGAK